MNGQLDLIMKRIWERRLAFFGTFFFVVLITYAFLVIIDFIPEKPEEVTGETTADEIETQSKNTPSSSFLPDFFTNNDRSEEPLPNETPVSSEEPGAGDVADRVAVRATETTSVTTNTSSLTATTRAIPANALPTTIIFDDLGNKQVRVLNPSSSDIATLDNALLSGVVRHPDSADFSEPGNIFILGHSSYLPNVINKNYQAFNGIQKLTWGDTIRVRSADTEYFYRVEEVFEAPASEIFVPATPGKAKLTLATCDVLGAKEDRFIVEAVLYDSKPL